MNHEPGLIPLSDEERRAIGLWAAECAAQALPHFEAHAPADTRPRAAIDGIRDYARGGKRTAYLRSLALAALAAAREAGEPAATAAARAAGYAAATAYMHPTAPADHQAKHAFGPAVYGALAAELAAGGAIAAGVAAIEWAVEHASPPVRDLVRRMPARGAGRSRLDALYHQLDAGLRR